jgi:hypothetical protein
LSDSERLAMRVRAKTCFDEQFNYEATSKRLLAILEALARERKPRA